MLDSVGVVQLFARLSMVADDCARTGVLVWNCDALHFNEVTLRFISPLKKYPSFQFQNITQTIIIFKFDGLESDSLHASQRAFSGSVCRDLESGLSLGTTFFERSGAFKHSDALFTTRFERVHERLWWNERSGDESALNFA